MAEKEKRDLLGEYRNRVTGEERLKVTISMPLWLKVYIWKDSKEKGIPVWEYLARLIEENEKMKREDKNQYIFKLEDELGKLLKENRKLEEELEKYKKLSEDRKDAIGILKKIIMDIKDRCGDCAREVLMKYRRIGVQDEVLIDISQFADDILSQ
jgi:predicted RNase H-like nuclease (RuvC/YqgF family)